MYTLALLLGKRIRQKRKSLGMSQERLAFACGLDRSYMGRIERGEVNITVVSLYQIASALNCSSQELLPKSATVTLHFSQDD
ncbi:transcriptional regulator [Pseudohongiella nitratireducens]|uniref:Transcriptional regulator n=1 Tax=Pseudohongiella nitratireducens TaxID=1768907 RepID=A0A916QJ53_9GAMM|nr:helix-turn-helix transcriptional regulator [Pseudohongiella nitratireducens]GFZ76333.1 transcriptional regulator [Pseudohongiella nitratireducens]